MYCAVHDGGVKYHPLDAIFFSCYVFFFFFLFPRFFYVFISTSENTKEGEREGYNARDLGPAYQMSVRSYFSTETRNTKIHLENIVEKTWLSRWLSFATSLTQGGCDETESDQKLAIFVWKPHHNQIERGKSPKVKLPNHKIRTH